MEQELTIAPPAPTKKVYTSWMVYVATFIGGPLIGGYLASRNFMVFGDKKKAYTAIWLGSLATILLICLAIVTPESFDTGFRIVPLATTLATYYLVKHYQQPYIDSHRYEGGPIFSWGRTILLGLASLAIMAIFIFWIMFFMALREA